ncbi:DUF421 domain-containing protein [Cupriavidus consociatus]|uniref:DUF421 domain-containing protein n=1 Tax=Cupriavidus consociatus TaxID=2821357 RepID=UPI001AE856B7|nr:MULTISPECIES: DUF421 domain-containing protein [unclassified Cupriavidus]MBP0619557.1 DUF421 domain-containing protein [Cupriavidus sp. LEh25]MDK2656207.1 DUF421 domain-containing protein [Cupriavidus sp. LEh21]
MDVMEILVDVMRRAVGEGDDLQWWQGAVRAAVIFVGTWAMLRLAGRRAFAQKSAFDLCIVLLLGAVLSRAVVGATSLTVAFTAALVLVLLHRAVGWLSGRFPPFDCAIGGHALDLLSRGELDRERISRAMLTEEDLKASLRASLQSDSFSGLARVVLERDGKVTFVRRSSEDVPAKNNPATPSAPAAPAVSRSNGVPVRSRSSRQ